MTPTITNPVHVLPPIELLLTDPVMVLLKALKHVADIDAPLFSDRAELRLTLYHSALSGLAWAYGDQGQRLYDHYAETLPTGTPVKDASPDELRRTTLAMYGLTRDRVTHGVRSRPIDTWLEMADEALSAYKQRRAS